MIVIGSSNFVISPTQVFSFDIHVREKYLFGGYLKHKWWAWLVWGQIKMNECRNGTFRSADVDSKRRGRVGRWRLLLVCGVETTSVVGFTHQPPLSLQCSCKLWILCGGSSSWGYLTPWLIWALKEHRGPGWGLGVRACERSVGGWAADSKPSPRVK